MQGSEETAYLSPNSTTQGTSPGYWRIHFQHGTLHGCPTGAGGVQGALWLEDLDFSPPRLFHGLLELPHGMVAGFPEQCPKGDK